MILNYSNFGLVSRIWWELQRWYHNNIENIPDRGHSGGWMSEGIWSDILYVCNYFCLGEIHLSSLSANFAQSPKITVTSSPS